jgi:hypothetical protein
MLEIRLTSPAENATAAPEFLMKTAKLDSGGDPATAGHPWFSDTVRGTKLNLQCC